MSNTSSVAYRRVYVWEVPVRVYHWLNAICMLVLIVTGYLMGKPLAIRSSAEAYQQYWFGIIRFTHFATAFILVFNFIFRLYWGFVGNKYAHWRNFIPLRKEQWQEIVDVIKVDVLHVKTREAMAVGHNMLAGFTYFLSFLVFLFQAATGFALYSAMSGSFIARLFRWVVPLMGSESAVRQWHHLAMWFFVVFTLVHLYLVYYHDHFDDRGGTSSMWDGWLQEREDVLEEQ